MSLFSITNSYWSKRCINAPRWCRYAPTSVQICISTDAYLHCFGAYLHRCKACKKLGFNTFELSGAFMHQQITTIYNILYSIYIIIYYLFVVFLPGSYTFVSNNLVTINRPQPLPSFAFPLFPSHHSLSQNFSSFTPSFFISQP
jgi:hypothetical protein